MIVQVQHWVQLECKCENRVQLWQWMREFKYRWTKIIASGPMIMHHQSKLFPKMKFGLFFLQPSSIHGWTSAFLLTVHRFCGVIERRLRHFLPRWLKTGWQSVISQGKIPWNTPPWLGIEPRPQGGQTVSYSTELSWLDIHVLFMTKLSQDHLECLFLKIRLMGRFYNNPKFQQFRSSMRKHFAH